ncbi:MAG TPA: DUF805 domain-containing protein [Candidatus Woesebacteria bacterium]|nr:DUF805 domain-containing protein [Candidatus Woesebacteria bacterium]
MKINYKDRLGRKDFIIAIILTPIIVWIPIFVLWAVVSLIDTIFALMLSTSGILSLFFIVAPIVASGILSLSILVRRHHDLNQSWVIPVIIAFVLLVLSSIDKGIGGLMSFVYFLYLAFSKSVNEGNKYGKPISYKNVWEKIGIIKK